MNVVGQGTGTCFSMSLNFSGSLVFFLSSVNFTSSGKSMDSAIAAWALTAQAVAGRWEKLFCVSLVLHILYYYHYNYCLFPLWSYQTLFISTCEFYFFSISLPDLTAGGKKRGSGCVVLAASCWIKSRQISLRCWTAAKRLIWTWAVYRG